MLKVMIDIGHLGNDSGAVYEDLREVDFNEKVALKVIDLLKRHDIEVLVSTGSLTDRVKLEHEHRPDYFISIHTNAGGGHGSEIFVYERGGINETIASNILDEIVLKALNTSRGVKTANFYVLRATYAPALLVEMAFIDTSDIEAIMTDEKQQRMAECIVKGFLKAVNVPYKEEEQVVSPAPPITQDEVLYRVCVGSYRSRENAVKEVERLKSIGLSAFLHTCAGS